MAAAMKSAAVKTAAAEAASAPTVASGPSCVNQGDRCDAD
jgi:hypothetical protein